MRDAYTIRLDWHEGNIWGHIEVRHWSHRVAREVQRDVDRIVAEHGAILATPTAEHATGQRYEVWRKFMRLIGFSFMQTKTDGAGVRHAIYGRTK